MPMKIHHPYFSVKACKAAPDDLFVFGDNLDRYGKGGQAAIRDCENAIGFATKISPNTNNRAFFTDNNSDLLKDEILRFHNIVTPHLRAGGTVWWPADGIGTGLSEMPKRAPALYARMCKYTRGLFEYDAVAHVSAIICGGRDYTDRKNAFHRLDYKFGSLIEDGAVVEVIQGGAKGADTLAGQWADERELAHTKVPANWNKYGKRAGFIRNSEMAEKLQARKDQTGARAMVIGMPGGTGTKMMLQIAYEQGFEVSRIEADPEYTPPPVIAYKPAKGIIKTLAEEPQQSMDI